MGKDEIERRRGQEEQQFKVYLRELVRDYREIIKNWKRVLLQKIVKRKLPLLLHLAPREPYLKF